MLIGDACNRSEETGGRKTGDRLDRRSDGRTLGWMYEGMNGLKELTERQIESTTVYQAQSRGARLMYSSYRCMDMVRICLVLVLHKFAELWSHFRLHFSSSWFTTIRNPLQTRRDKTTSFHSMSGWLFIICKLRTREPKPCAKLRTQKREPGRTANRCDMRTKTAANHTVLQSCNTQWCINVFILALLIVITLCYYFMWVINSSKITRDMQTKIAANHTVLQLCNTQWRINVFLIALLIVIRLCYYFMWVINSGKITCVT